MIPVIKRILADLCYIFWIMGLQRVVRKFDMFLRFDRADEHDRRTDRWADLP